MLEWISPILSIFIFSILFGFIIYSQNKLTYKIKKLEKDLPTKRQFEKANGSLERLTLMTENIGTHKCPFKHGYYCTFNESTEKVRQKIIEGENKNAG